MKTVKDHANLNIHHIVLNDTQLLVLKLLETVEITQKFFPKTLKKIVLPRRIRRKLFRKKLLRKILGAQQIDIKLNKKEVMQTAAKSSCKKSTNKQIYIVFVKLQTMECIFNVNLQHMASHIMCF